MWKGLYHGEDVMGKISSGIYIKEQRRSITILHRLYYLTLYSQSPSVNSRHRPSNLDTSGRVPATYAYYNVAG